MAGRCLFNTHLMHITRINIFDRPPPPSGKPSGTPPNSGGEFGYIFSLQNQIDYLQCKWPTISLTHSQAYTLEYFRMTIVLCTN